jgi:hypothetical protein
VGEKEPPRAGTEPFGREAILAQHPHTRPEKIKKSPAPFVHAATKATRQFFYGIYSELVAAYRTAAEKLREIQRRASRSGASRRPCRS